MVIYNLTDSGPCGHQHGDVEINVNPPKISTPTQIVSLRKQYSEIVQISYVDSLK